MNPYAKKIMHMQVKLCNTKKKGRRFTVEEKLIALSIMKQSPKCYRFLNKLFILPSRSTLSKMVEKLNVQSGICPQVMSLIKEEVSTWAHRKKFCSIIFDEMSLETNLTYDKKKDSITGFVDLKEKKKQFADHALVFMLRGAIYKWQQPVTFYFCQGATSGIELKSILKDMVSAVLDCGLKPVALICDQGSAFQSAVTSLKQDTKREQLLADKSPDGTVTISGVNLSIIYDPPHLIKGLRNNFLNKNIIFDGKVSKWSDIVEVYNADCDHTEFRTLHQLTDQHVLPEKIKKMKVKNCVKVFSSTVARALHLSSKFPIYGDGNATSKTLRNTAEIVMFFDKLFDSVNGASLIGSKREKNAPKKVLRTAVTEKSPHHEFWREAIKKLKRIKYIDGSGKEKSVPSLKKFITTLESFMRLWQLLKNEGLKIMRPRYFNSDPIENFFGQVRAYNYRSNDPSCHSFICTFKSLLLTKIIKFHNSGFNCEEDSADPIIKMETLFGNCEKNISTNSENIIEQARREKLIINSRAYTTGWVVRKLGIKCETCKKNFTTNEPTNIHDWISHREYTKTKNSLNYPSEGAVRCFGAVVNETNEYLENKGHHNNLSKNIKELILSKYSFDFNDCADHKNLLDIFINITIRFTIYNWCLIINRILKGTDISRLDKRPNIPSTQKMAYEKYKKKLKNKSFNK